MRCSIMVDALKHQSGLVFGDLMINQRPLLPENAGKVWCTQPLGGIATEVAPKVSTFVDVDFLFTIQTHSFILVNIRRLVVQIGRRGQSA